MWIHDHLEGQGERYNIQPNQPSSGGVFGTIYPSSNSHSLSSTLLSVHRLCLHDHPHPSYTLSHNYYISLTMAADGPKPGFLGNINQDQEAKLQKLWSVLLKAAEAPSGDEPSTGAAEEPTSPTQPQRRHSLLSRTQSNVSEKTTASVARSPYQRKVMAYLKELGIGAHETKMVQKALSEIAPLELRTGVLNLLKHDNPDAMLLRFLRARKWDVSKAFAMMMDAIVWRVKEMHVDDDVMAKGEMHALQQERNNANVVEKKAGKDFLAQMRMGKAYVHGTDKLGRPIVVIKVRLHKPGAQSEETLERYIVHVIESVRLTLSPPVETAVGSRSSSRSIDYFADTLSAIVGRCIRHDRIRVIQHGMPSIVNEASRSCRKDSKTKYSFLHSRNIHLSSLS
jgi:hypothetical protein